MVRAKKQATLNIERIEHDLERARTEIKQASRSREDRIMTVKEIVRIADKHVLVPRLGNFLLGATQAIKIPAEKLGIEIISIDERGISEFLQDEGEERRNAFKAYTVRAGIRSGYNDLMRLCAAIEKSNPYLCISHLKIRADLENPLRHVVNVDVQWPIWSDPEMYAGLSRQLEHDREAPQEKSLE